jgi:hypothetical protein
MEQEIWKDIKGFEGYYQVSNLGRVRSLDRIVHSKGLKLKWSRLEKGHIVKFGNTRGYVIAPMCVEGKKYAKLVNRLVAIAFLPNPQDLPEVNHKNGNKLDNSVVNLEWCTHADNMNHASFVIKTHIVTRGGQRQLFTKLTDEQREEIVAAYRKGENRRVIAKRYNIVPDYVNILNNSRSSE